jgi:hypothetical protein
VREDKLEMGSIEVGGGPRSEGVNETVVFEET